MITQTTLLWLGTIGLLTNYVALSRANDSQTRAVGLGFGFLFFVVFTISSTDYGVWTDAGVQISVTSMPLAVIGFIATAISLVLLLETAMRMLRQ